jgi:serine/threonine-protein kinase
MQFRCPNCQHPILIEDQALAAPAEETVDTVECPACHSRFSLSSDSDSTTISTPGMKIAHFEIEEFLGEGSFGTVYKAWDTELQRHVALKVPREGRVTKDTSKQFLREARAAAGIKHTNVVGIYEMGQHGDGYYIAAELIDGISLSDYLRNHAFEHAAAAQLVIKVLRGVQTFHDKGIIHRDLKPGNILLDGQNEPHISDFGLARSDDQADLTVTHSGKIVGTLLYMSPEQARGEAKLTPRSDIYAVGVVLYEMLTGQRPFKSTSSRTLLYSILTDPPPSPRKVCKTIPRDLETICLKAMEKDPLRRYASASKMADDLQLFLEGKPILARPVSVFEKTWRLARRYRLVSALLALLVPLIATVIFLLVRGTVVRHPVHLSFTLAGNNVPADAKADWTILPLHKRTREPVEAQAIRISQAGDANLKLEPGEYLVVVVVPGFGFHEVYRYVPEEPNVAVKSSYPHERWDVTADGVLDLPRISIRSEGDVLQGMVEVPGGQFQMGDGKSNTPKHTRNVESFFVDPTEVTAADSAKFTPLPTGYTFPPDFPRVEIHWNAAVAYAEFIGKRLLKENEFEFLARDRGQSNFPSGDEPVIPPGDPWPYLAAGQPDADKLTSLPIYGIHSNVAEWTDSLDNLYPGVIDPGPERDRLMNIQRNRIVRGGPVTAGPNDRSLNTWDQSTSHREAWDVRTMDSEIGFRCGRSAKPRFQKKP